MKKLLGIGLLSLLLSGCKVSSVPSREHQIICYDPTHTYVTYNVTVPGNVFAFVVEGHSVLEYPDVNNKPQIIFLSKNDCEIF